MMRSKLTAIAGAAAFMAISVHLVATLLQNTPDAFNLDLRRYTGGWTIPGWRFFAPNPGIQNVHLLARTAPLADAEAAAADWRDITPTIPHGVLNVAMNPKSRGPKALFDAMQQLTVLRGNYSAFDFLVTTTPYALIADAARGYLGDVHDSYFQFLLMNYFPSAEQGQRMAPVLISEWLPVRAGDAR